MFNKEEEEKRTLEIPKQSSPQIRQQNSGIKVETQTPLIAATNTFLEPSPLDSSLAKYCYDDEQSILFSPLPTPLGVNPEIVSGTQRSCAREDDLSPLCPLQLSPQSLKKKEVISPTEIIASSEPLSENQGRNRKDADTASSGSSFISSSFLGEQESPGVYHFDVVDSSGLKSFDDTFNTFDRYHQNHNSSEKCHDKNIEEEKKEICKTPCNHPQYNSANYIESPVCKPSNKADYIQELYRKVIAANNNPSTQRSNIHSFEMLNSHRTYLKNNPICNINERNIDIHTFV